MVRGRAQRVLAFRKITGEFEAKRGACKPVVVTGVLRSTSGVVRLLSTVVYQYH